MSFNSFKNNDTLKTIRLQILSTLEQYLAWNNQQNQAKLFSKIQNERSFNRNERSFNCNNKKG